MCGVISLENRTGYTAKAREQKTRRDLLEEEGSFQGHKLRLKKGDLDSRVLNVLGL